VDVLKPKKKSSFLNQKTGLILVSIIILLMLLSYAKASFNTVKLARKDLLIATVQQGDIDVTVEGYGRLISDKMQLLTALTRATVQEIVLKPGATVTKDSIIVRLANPELAQQVENAEQELAQIKANLRQLIVNQKRELLTEEANFAELDARYETAKLRRTAEQTLVTSGIVSELTYKESVLNEKQLKKRIEILKKRVEQLALVHKEAINIQQERIKQQQGRLNMAQQRLDKLQVKAGFDGVLQRLSVDLGQSLAAGQEIALIGSVTELIALVRVPQNQAQQVQIGQKVVVDTRLDDIAGEVVRINPIVENNTVEVEIALPKMLPKSARPQQNIDAIIVVASLKNIHYLARPANVKAQSDIALYKMASDSQSALRTAMTLGQKTGRFIELKSGAKRGERFIISDLSNYQTKQIVIE
jgi:HlyD family secretion protein